MKKPKIYHEDWSERDWNGKLRKNKLELDFQVKLTNEQILFAVYTYRDYSGSAFVLFKKGRSFYEVNGGHCSCNGLEGQWEPELTNIKVLEKRLNGGNVTGYDHNHDKDLAKTLKWLKENK